LENAAVDSLLAAYGEGGLLPTRAQWEHLLASPGPRRIVVVNFFRIREKADPALTGGESLSGFEAMIRYSSVSTRKVAEVGGRFLSTALFDSVLMGTDEAWSLVAIAEYPSPAALIRLFADAEYQEAHRFRLAAVESQRVVVANAL
jgi:uncharacterized protein (DUF1330 family)